MKSNHLKVFMLQFILGLVAFLTIKQDLTKKQDG